MRVSTFINICIKVKVLIPKRICKGNMIFSLAYATLLGFICFVFLLTQANESLSGAECLYISGSSMLNPKQIQPKHHPPVPPVQLKLNSLFLCIVLAKLLIINRTILSDYQSSVGVSIGSEVQAPTVWIKQLFPLSLFFGLMSSALDWSEPSGHRLRCIQNFNVAFSIV